MSSRIVCFCNNVGQDVIDKAIAGGATTLTSIYDQTGAGVGPCGGSCRELIKSLIPHPASQGSSDFVLPDKVVEAISLFNRRYYWETHEILEDLWMDEHGPLRLFYQGIIQAAAAMYHVLNANPKGVIKLGQEALNKLQQYRPIYQSIKIELLCRRLTEYVDQAKDILGNTRNGFDYDRLPIILVGSDMKVGE